MNAGNGPASTSTPLGTGDWVRVTHTRNSISGVVKTYVNGVFVSQAISEVGQKGVNFRAIGATTVDAADLTTVLGYNYLQGDLDQVEVFDRELTAQEVSRFHGPSAGSVPSAPTPLSATANTPTQVTLNFADVADEAGYAIYRCDAGGAFALLTTTAPDQTSYVDRTVLQGTQYDPYTTGRRDDRPRTAGEAMKYHRGPRIRCGPVLISTCVLAAVASLTAEPTPSPDSKPAPQPPATPAAVEHSPVIKDVYQKHFLIGAAGDFPGNYSDAERALAKAHFNVLTPENCMKPALVHPQEDVWRFERPDALVKFCEDNGLAVFGHTLVWHAQTNDWFFRGGDKAAVTERLRSHIHTLVGRYTGRVLGWDVVNEAISDRPDPTSENLRNSQWLQTLGPEFLTLAFKFAHEADPTATLYYNDYNIEAGAKHESSMILLRRLIKEGAPVHGVGIQGHWSTHNVPYDAIDRAIADYASLGLKVSITELDVTIRGTSGGQLGAGPGRRRARTVTPASAEDLNAQADAYARLFAIFVKHEGAIERVTFWGLSDRRTWRFGQHPLIFDGNNERKPCYTSITNVLLSPAP